MTLKTIPATALQPHVVARVDRIEAVLDGGVKIGWMLVDKFGVNCIRHEHDRFLLIMDWDSAQTLFAACRRQGATSTAGQGRP